MWRCLLQEYLNTFHLKLLRSTFIRKQGRRLLHSCVIQQFECLEIIWVFMLTHLWLSRLINVLKMSLFGWVLVEKSHESTAETNRWNRFFCYTVKDKLCCPSVSVGLNFTIERSPVLAAVSRAVNTQTDGNHCVGSLISADFSLFPRHALVYKYLCWNTAVRDDD